MKILKNITLGLVALVGLALTSCSNDLPEFNDADAFVSLRETSASINETGGELEIPVLLSSLSGKSGSVDFEITADETAPAVEGTHFTVENTSNTLTFTKDENTQYIKLKIIDNDTYGGDVRLTITLKNAQGVKLGADNTCTVTIEDDEHPLAFMLGSYTATGDSYFNGGQEWTVKIAKDDSDVSKVWITNFVYGGSSASSPIYGTVNSDNTEIHIPVKQTLATSSSYPHIWLEAYSADGEQDIEDYIVGKITVDDNGVTTISFPDYMFGSLVYSDDAATTTAGWYNLFNAGVVLKLNK